MKNLTLLLISLFIVFSCGKKKEDNSEEETTTKDWVQLSNGNYSVENAQMTWKGSKKIGDAHHGKLTIASGNVSVVEGNLQEASLKIDMSSLVAEDLVGEPEDKEKLEMHLKSADFFSVEEFPDATFQLTKSEPLQGEATHTCTDEDEDHDNCVACAASMSEGQMLQVTGNLTIKGNENPVSFPVFLSSQEEGLHMKASFVIDRTKWDVRYNSENFITDLVADKIINDEIKITFDVKANKQEMEQTEEAPVLEEEQEGMGEGEQEGMGEQKE